MPDKLARVILKQGRDRSARKFHPWIFSGAIEWVDDFHKPGDLVSVHAHDRAFLGTGYLNPKSQIAVRILSFHETPINLDFFKSKIRVAQELRNSFISDDTDCYRLIHSEGDFLPGLIVDRYGSCLVAQFQTLGMDRLKPLAVEALQSVVSGIDSVWERSDAPSRNFEGLEKQTGVLFGKEPPPLLEVKENGNRYLVDILKGQKTGFFIDQRENRKLVQTLAKGKSVLNCFAYTGGFSVAALKGGAGSVVSVETSEEAARLCALNVEKNGFSPEQHLVIEKDVFDFLRSDASEYDIIILDPPAFCKNKSQLQQAARGYKDINLCALKCLKPGGFLFTFSCSSHLDGELFRKVVSSSAQDAGKNLQVIMKTTHPPDHPLNIFHSEGEYLKGLLCRLE